MISTGWPWPWPWPSPWPRWSWWPGGGWAWAGSSRRRGFTSLWWAHILHIVKCLRALVDDLKYCILLRFNALGDLMIIALIPRNEAQNSSSFKRIEAKCCNCKAIKTWCCAVNCFQHEMQWKWKKRVIVNQNAFFGDTIQGKCEQEASANAKQSLAASAHQVV